MGPERDGSSIARTMPGALSMIRRLTPSRDDYRGLRTSWRGDVLAGITVGVVALPLALAFGVTSGVGAAAGLVTAIIAGLVAAIFGGSSLQVSGPTGAMAVVLLPIVATYGVGAVTTVAIMAGVLVLVLGFLGLGRAIAFVPWPVIEGFTLGIAIIIALQQVPYALGVPKPPGDRALVVAWDSVKAAGGETTLWAIGMVALAALIMVVLPRIRRSLPASLIAVVATTLIVWAVSADVPLIGHIPSSLPAPSLPALDPGTLSDLARAALAVAALAAIESLLSARVADGMSDVHPTQPDRELVGQGLASMASGLFGGMPATGAIARTAVNVRAGARTRVSAITHSLFLALVVFVGASLVGHIPLAALAGVLIVTAVRMVDASNALAIVRSTRSDALVFVLTAVITVAFDLILAVEIGIGVAIVLALRALARASGVAREDVAPAEAVDADEEHALLEEHIAVYRLDGGLFFGASQRFLDELTEVSSVRVVILRLGFLQVLDATGAQALGEIGKSLERRGVTVLLCGVQDPHRKALEAVGAFEELRHENHVFTSLDAAIAHARDHMSRPVPPGRTHGHVGRSAHGAH